MLFHSMDFGHSDCGYKAMVTITYEVPEGIEPVPVMAVRARELAKAVLDASAPAAREIVDMLRWQPPRPDDHEG